MKKIARQQTCSVEEAADHRADRERERETPAQVPIALPRSCGGKALVMIESVAGIISAAPMPWIARLATSQPSVCARPRWPRSSAKMTTPMRKTCAGPKMSPRRPPVASRTAKVSV